MAWPKTKQNKTKTHGIGTLSNLGDDLLYAGRFWSETLFFNNQIARLESCGAYWELPGLPLPQTLLVSTVVYQKEPKIVLD